MQTPIIELRDIFKQYQGSFVLQGVNLNVIDSEFLSIMGPSGSGKSTLLKILAGVISPSRGTMQITSSLPNGECGRFNGIVMVWQSLALFPHMNVAQNVGFGLRVRGVPKNQADNEITRALEMVGLSGYQKRTLSELSGGEQQRIALARAIILRPRVLLLDEPFGALDAHLRAQLLASLRDIHTSLRLTCIMVTHDQTEAMAASTRVAVLNKGRVEQIGDPNDIWRRPCSPFVARFVGRKNVLTGHVSSVNSEIVCVKIGNREFLGSVAPWTSTQFSVGEAIAYVIEPHLIQFNKDVNIGNSVHGAIVGTAAWGAMRTVDVNVADLGVFHCEIPAATSFPDCAIEGCLSWCYTDAYVLKDLPTVQEYPRE